MPAYYLNRKAGDIMAKEIEDLIDKLKDIAGESTEIFNKITEKLKDMASYAIDVGSKFEESMSKVQAISGATSDQMSSLSEKAKEMGANTKFSANETAEAFSDLAQQGLKTSDMLDSIDGSMRIATVTGESLSNTAGLVSDSISSFGLQAKDSAHFADILASSSTASNSSMNLMADAFKVVSPIAGALKYSMEDTALAIGLMADAGIKGEDAGKSLGAILSNLANPPKEATKALNDLGVSLSNADGTMKPLSEVLQELRGRFSGLSDSQKESYAAAIASKAGMDGFLGLINGSDEDFNKLSSSIVNANGSAEKMSAVIGDNLNSKLSGLHNSLETLGITAYQKFQGPMKEAVETASSAVNELVKSMTTGELAPKIDKIADAFSKLVKAFSELVAKWIPKIIDGLGWILDHSELIASGIFAIKAAIMAMNVANTIKGVVDAFVSAKKATDGLTIAQYLYNQAISDNPIGALIALIVGVIAAVVYLWNTNDDFREAVISAWTAICDTASEVWGAVCTFFTETIPNAFQVLVDFFANIPQFFSDLWNGILNTILAWGDSVTNFFTTTIPQWIANIIAWFSELPYNLGYALGLVIGTLVQWGIDTLTYLVNNVPVWIDNISTWFSQLPGLIANWLLGVVSNIVAWGASVYDYLVNNVPIWINNVITWFSQLPGSIWEWLVNAFNNIVTWGANVYNNTSAAIGNTINSVIAWFSQLPGSIWTWLVNTITNLGVWGANMISEGSQAAGNLVDSIGDIISSLPDKMLDIGENIVRGIWDGISGMASWISNKVGSFASGVIDGFKSALGIHSPSRVMRDIVGVNIVKGIGAGIDGQMPDLNTTIISNLDELTSRIKTVIGVEAYKNASGAINASAYITSRDDGQNVVNNDNGVTQNITFNNPVSTPSETARAIKRVGRELAFG
jgi:TP901 family phage tail tape measure protein